MVEGVSDGEIVRRIARQDDRRDAEAELCRRFAPRIRLYGLRHLRSDDRAADLVQGVLLAVLEAARQGRIAEPDHVDRFVLGTCRNVAARVHETESRAKPTPTDELDVEVYLPELERIDAGPLMNCVAKLDGRSRTIVFLSFHDEVAADEIAEKMQMSAGNIRVVRHRALAQLRRCLDGQGAEP